MDKINPSFLFVFSFHDDNNNDDYDSKDNDYISQIVLT